MLPLPPIRTGHDSSKSSSFKPCASRASGTGSHRNEHTASAGEMVSAFAEENNLAINVETKTPGRLLSGTAYKGGHGYILGLPVAAYLTWQGRMLESNGIAPKFSIELSREALKQGRDTQLGTAIDVAKAL
jgi:C-terminal processing protease CtpA/Prc